MLVVDKLTETKPKIDLIKGESRVMLYKYLLEKGKYDLVIECPMTTLDYSKRKDSSKRYEDLTMILSATLVKGKVGFDDEDIPSFVRDNSEQFIKEMFNNAMSVLRRPLTGNGDVELNEKKFIAMLQSLIGYTFTKDKVNVTITKKLGNTTNYVISAYNIDKGLFEELKETLKLKETLVVRDSELTKEPEKVLEYPVQIVGLPDLEIYCSDKKAWKKLQRANESRKQSTLKLELFD